MESRLVFVTDKVSVPFGTGTNLTPNWRVLRDDINIQYWAGIPAGQAPKLVTASDALRAVSDFPLDGWDAFVLAYQSVSGAVLPLPPNNTRFTVVPYLLDQVVIPGKTATIPVQIRGTPDAWILPAHGWTGVTVRIDNNNADGTDAVLCAWAYLCKTGNVITAPTRIVLP